MKKPLAITACAVAALLLSSLATSAAGSERKKIAVLPLIAPGIADDTVQTVSAVIRKTFSPDRMYISAGGEISRNEMDNLYRDAGGSPDPDVLKSISEKSGVPKIITGILSRAGTGYIIRCSLFDAPGNTIEYETIESSGDEAGIRESARQAAARISMYLEGSLPVVTGTMAGEGISLEYVPVSWQSIQEAGEYHVYRAPSEFGDFRPAGRTMSAFFNDADAIPGVRYWYRVRGVKDGIFTDFSGTTSGYRKIPPPAGLALDSVLKEHSETPADPGSDAEKKKIQRDEGILKSYYMEPMQLTLVMYFAGSYIKSGKIIILRDFDTWIQNDDIREIVLTSSSSPYIISFKSKRLFRIRDTGGAELFERLLQNSLFYCAYTGDREIIMEDGTRYMVPGFEAVGMSTGYYRHDRNWRDRTIMLSTDNKEFADQIKKAGGG